MSKKSQDVPAAQRPPIYMSRSIALGMADPRRVVAKDVPPTAAK